METLQKTEKHSNFSTALTDMKKPIVIAIIQARMGSTRLPRKMLADIAGKQLLVHVIERVGAAKNLDEVVVATSDKRQDSLIIDVASKCGVKSFAGSEEDVLDRFLKAAEKFGADQILRICADNPLVDPWAIDELVTHHLRTGADYSYNSGIHAPHSTGLPDGSGAEIVTMDVLRKIHRTFRTLLMLIPCVSITPHMKVILLFPVVPVLLFGIPVHLHLP